MEIIGKPKLIKLKKKNVGNKVLAVEVDKLIADLEALDLKKEKLTDIRGDADCVHSDGFYFFDLNVHRSLILVDFDDQGVATIVWVGSHDEYARIFKNNKPTIEKWLRKNGHIE